MRGIRILRRAWGTLKKRNGKTVVQKQTPIGVAEYQQSLEKGEVPAELTPGSVRYWSDFNRVFMHPRSVVQLNDYELSSSIQPFERWQTGEELFAELDKEHDLLDRDLRPFVEEADHMQAIQVFTTIDDAWGGFAARYSERLRDEYAKSVVWVWGLQDSGMGLNRVGGFSDPMVDLIYANRDILTNKSRKNAC